MTVPFVTGLRVGPDAIIIGGGNGALFHLRVQQAELWETVRVDAPASESVAAVKAAALGAFFPNGSVSDDFVVKVRGYEILREADSLTASGAKNGSTLLLARRRRRAVR